MALNRLPYGRGSVGRGSVTGSKHARMLLSRDREGAVGAEGVH